MPYFDFFWTDDIIAHIAEHDITPRDFEWVVMHPFDTDQRHRRRTHKNRVSVSTGSTDYDRT